MRWMLLIPMMLSGLVVAQEPAAERQQKLLTVRRIYVDKLNGKNAEQIRDLLIAGLLATRLFVITENAEKADAFLRGTASDDIFTETHQSSGGIDARMSMGTLGTGNRRMPASSVGIGDRETLRISERRHEALASLRLVDKDGDVIWSTTQESRGAKFRGASADLVDKVAQRLVEEVERLRGKPATKSED